MGDNRLYEVGETSFVVLCDETMLPHLQVHVLRQKMKQTRMRGL